MVGHTCNVPARAVSWAFMCDVCGFMYRHNGEKWVAITKIEEQKHE